MTKYILIGIVIGILIFAVTGCANKDIQQDKHPSDADVAVDYMKSFLNALEQRDTAHLLSLFAPNALVKAEDIQAALKQLYLYYDGNFVSYEDPGALGVETSLEDNQIRQEMYATYIIETDRTGYRFAFLLVNEDTSNEENVGFWSVYIIKEDDYTDTECAYRGDGLYTPGIHIGIQNNHTDKD